jgi:hypothetical protein
MTRARRVQRRTWLAFIVVAALLAVLRDPPWLGAVTSGLSPWAQDKDGARFRWTTGHATLYVPTEAQTVIVPLRAERFTPDFLPVIVRLHVDGQPVNAIRLEDEGWQDVPIRVGLVRATRRHRRIEVRVNRTYGRLIRGIKLGEVRAKAH